MDQDESTTIDAGDLSSDDRRAARKSPPLAAARVSPPRRSSLRDLLLNDDEVDSSSTHRAAATDVVDHSDGEGAVAAASTAQKSSTVQPEQRSPRPTLTDKEDLSAPQGDSVANDDDDDESHNLSTSTNIKVVGTSYSGGKMQHLKKEDGLPLWRADIQYDLLNTIFSDESEVFTPLPPLKPSQDAGDADQKPDEQRKQRFVDLYIDAISRSEKTSKTLRHQLMTERTSAINIAMVCLLVNLGRMNTTLCFSPDMKAHLRTYHSIPCLQANVDDYEDHMYKQLQDAPRLKSILKRAADQDPNQIFTLDDLRKFSPPRMSPISLIFLLSQYAPKISKLHFTQPTDFYDLVLRSNLSSHSRARAFLWLMWFYLESDFSEEAALNNPFGPGEIVEQESERLLKIPPLVPLSDEELEKENVDTKDEIAYGESMRQQRKAMLQVEGEAVTRPTARRGGRVAHQEDNYSTGHAGHNAPELHADSHSSNLDTLLNSEVDADQSTNGDIAQLDPGRARTRRGTQAGTNTGNATQLATRIILKSKSHQDFAADPTGRNAVPDASSLLRTPMAEGKLEMRTPATGGSSRRARPMTQHQLALAQSRQQRIDHVLSVKRAEKLREMRELRKEAEVNTSVVMRAKQLLSRLPEDYDTDNDDEMVVNSHTVAVPNVNAAVNQNGISGVKILSQSRKSWGPGALCANPDIEEDYGELAQFYSSVLRKVSRRLNRWDWDAALHTAKNPEPSPKLVPVPEAPLPGTVGDTLPPVVKRGGRRRGVKRAAPTTPLAQSSADGHREKKPRNGARNKATDGTRRRGGRASAAALTKKEDEGENNEQLSALPARLQADTAHADSSDIEMSHISQLDDGDHIDDVLDSEPVQQPEDAPDESVVDDMDTTIGQFEPDQYSRSELEFAGPKPIPKSINRLRPQSHHPYHQHDSGHFGNNEDLDSEASSIAFLENDLPTSDIDGSAADGDEDMSLMERNGAGDDDHIDGGSNDSDGEFADQTLYSDTP